MKIINEEGTEWIKYESKDELLSNLIINDVLMDRLSSYQENDCFVYFSTPEKQYLLYLVKNHREEIVNFIKKNQNDPTT